MEGGYAFPPFWGDYPSQQLHLVCEVHDDGNFNLVAYRRVIITVK